MATPSNTHAGTGVVRALTLSVVAIQQNVLFVGYWTRVPLHLCMSVSISALLFLLSPFSTPEDRYHTTDKDSIKFTYKIRDRRISRCRLELMKCRSLGSGTAQCVPECVTHTHILASLLSISLFLLSFLSSISILLGMDALCEETPRSCASSSSLSFPFRVRQD